MYPGFDPTECRLQSDELLPLRQRCGRRGRGLRLVRFFLFVALTWLSVGCIIKVDIVQTRARFLSSPNSNFFVVDPRVYLLPGEMMVLV